MTSSSSFSNTCTDLCQQQLPFHSPFSPPPSLSTSPRSAPSSSLLAPPSPSRPPHHTPIPTQQPPPQDCREGRVGGRVELLEAPQLHHIHQVVITSNIGHPSLSLTLSGLERKGMIQPKMNARGMGKSVQRFSHLCPCWRRQLGCRLTSYGRPPEA